jgi:hypothetical protein
MAKSGKIGVALVVMGVVCAVQASCQTVTRPTDDNPAWQQQLAKARLLAADGKNVVLVVRPAQPETSGPGSVDVFHNHPDPFCYTYMIPGDWLAGPQENTYRSKDGRAVVGLRFLLPKDLEKIEGATLLERARKFVTAEYEQGLGRTLPSAGLLPFESQRPGTWEWMATTATAGERPVTGVANVLVDLKPQSVVQIAVSGTRDDAALARSVVESLQTTSDAECYWPLLERTLKDTSAKK